MEALVVASVRDFRIYTASRKPPARKKALQEEIEKYNTITDDARERCRKHNVLIDVCFFLYANSKERGRHEKDLDNLLKIVLDVLQVHMDSDKTSKGLGLIADDKKISSIICSKKFVNNESDEGIMIKIYDADRVTIELKESNTAQES